MTDTDEQKQLVDEYLKLDQVKQGLEANLKAIREKLVEFSRSHQRKTLRSGKTSLTVMVKSRTVFPKLDQPGRREIEAIIKESGILNDVLSFDVIKLAEAYDNKTLPDSVRKQLKSFVKTEEMVKIYLNEPSPASQTSLETLT
ncbi:MAG: hypothetical protein NTZ93_05130 [Candidatus Beckwithbacteria bacterium]|nr:hypothetical protein [Candidatus Beckwithbacteria bacterium]